MTEHHDTQPADSRPEPLSRRAVVRGVALGGLATPLLAACGGGSGAASGGSGSSAGSSSGSAATKVTAADVPVGGGTILATQQVVVTQPTKGHFKAFSAICTHMGCQVNKIASGKIECPCHGSAFSITDGAPLNGPAQQPLPAKKVTVSGGQITVS